MSDTTEFLEQVSEEELEKMLVEYRYSDTATLLKLQKKISEKEERSSQLEQLQLEIDFREKVRTLAMENKENLEFSMKKKMSKSISAGLSGSLLLYSIRRAMLLLKWEIIYFDEEVVEARNYNGWKYSEQISVEIKQEQLQIQSEHLESSTERKRNSKRINEFLIAFEAIRQELSHVDRRKLLEKNIVDIEKQNEYIVPDELTKPGELEEEKIGISIIGALALSAVLAGVLAVLSSFTYIIFLYDIGIGFLLAWGFSKIFPFSKCSDFKRLKWIGFLSILLTHFLCHVYTFFYVVKSNNIPDAHLFDYFSALFENGIEFKGNNLGSIGLLISWIIELAIAGVTFYSRLLVFVIKYDVAKIPQDVIDFSLHFFSQNKTEDEVREELRKKGWYNREQQDMVFKAIGGIAANIEMVREK